MKVLFLSKSGDGLGLAHYMKIQGHEVFLWIKEDKDFEYAGLGMFKKMRSWRTMLSEADLVLGDMVGLGSFEQEIKKAGKPYIGINQNADDLELDRAGQMEIMRRLSIKLPKSISFDSPRAAEAAIDMWNSPGFVIKPSGNLDTGKTYVCRDKETFLWALSTYSGSQNLVVQQIVEGVEVSTEGWFDGRSFVSGMWNHTFEEKRLLAGDLGPNTGCMGNVVRLADPGSKLVEVVKRFEPVLRNFKYVGPFDLNAIVNENGIFVLEATPRFGYDAIETLATMAEGDFTTQLGDFAKGALLSPRFFSNLGVAVRVHLPPYPFGQAKADERGRPIQLPAEANRKENLGYYLLTDAYKDVNITEADTYSWAASDGVVGKVTYATEDFEECLDEVYTAVGQIKCLDLGYRPDIGARYSSDLSQLSSWGVL